MYQENKDDIAEITLVVTAWETEKEDLETKMANSQSQRQIDNYTTQIAELTTAITDAKAAKDALQFDVTAYETAKLEEE